MHERVLRTLKKCCAALETTRVLEVETYQSLLRLAWTVSHTKDIYHDAFDNADLACGELAGAAPSGVSVASPSVAVSLPVAEEGRQPLQDPLDTPAGLPNRLRWRHRQELQFHTVLCFFSQSAETVPRPMNGRMSHAASECTVRSRPSSSLFCWPFVATVPMPHLFAFKNTLVCSWAVFPLAPYQTANPRTWLPPKSRVRPCSVALLALPLTFLRGSTSFRRSHAWNWRTRSINDV